MNIEAWLRQSTQQLETAGIETARLDCLILLEEVTGKDRGHLLAHPETELSIPQHTQLQKYIQRRMNHEPIAYIRGKAEFYGREFIVNKHVLQPRPESETMIDLLKKLIGNPDIIADIGTGSGALAITAQLEFPSAEVIAIDIDPECLKVAQQNAQNLNADVRFVEGDLLAPFITDAPTILLCNLPYVPDTYTVNNAAMHEPRLALFGGPDGLDLYRKMFDQIDLLQHKPQYILTESLPTQHHGLATIARSHNYTQTQKSDFIQLFEPQ